MSSTFWLKVGDLKPAITATLLDADSNAVNISGATVEFTMRLIDDELPFVEAPADVLQVGEGEDGSRGKVRYQWLPGDSDVEGGYASEWVVTFADETQATFPNDDYKYVAVLPRVVQVGS